MIAIMQKILCNIRYENCSILIKISLQILQGYWRNVEQVASRYLNRCLTSLVYVYALLGLNEINYMWLLECVNSIPIVNRRVRRIMSSYQFEATDSVQICNFTTRAT